MWESSILSKVGRRRKSRKEEMVVMLRASSRSQRQIMGREADDKLDGLLEMLRGGRWLRAIEWYRSDSEVNYVEKLWWYTQSRERPAQYYLTSNSDIKPF